MTENRVVADIVKRLFLSVFLLLFVALLPFQADAAGDRDYIKVGLKFGNTAVAQCSITSPDGFLLGYVEDDTGFTETLPLPAYTELTAQVQDGHVELRDSAGVLISADIGIDGCLMPYSDGEQNFLSLYGQTYRGGVMLKAGSGDMLTVINYLTMDEYLYGVIHREMNMGNPPEALKAQAVAARTFAVLNKDRHSSDGFDVCATTHCQVYGGYQDEYESTRRAVDETSGVVLHYQGEVAECYYHKNSGGHTQSSEDEWQTRAPHLKGIPDPYSPLYPWKASIGFDTLRQKLIQAGQDPGTVEWVQIGSRDGSGAVSSLIIQGEEDRVELKKSMIRAALGNSLVRSRHFSLGDVYEGSAPSAGSAKLTLLSARDEKTTEHLTSVYVLSAEGDAKEAKIATLSFIKGDGTVKAQPASSEPGSDIFDDSRKASGGTLTLTGVGYGHGVGMAQDGAIEMAKLGMDYEAILRFYFTDVEVY